MSYSGGSNRESTDKPILWKMLMNIAEKLDDFGQFISGEKNFGEKIDTAITNSLTGEVDYNRQLEMLQKEQAFNSAEAEKNRQYNTLMSNSAFQRQAEDLQRSGYNPALVLGGSGASYSSVNTPYATQQSTKHTDSFIPFVSGLINSAFSLVRSSMDNQAKMFISDDKNDTAVKISDDKNDTAVKIAHLKGYYLNNMNSAVKKYNTDKKHTPPPKWYKKMDYETYKKHSDNNVDIEEMAKELDKFFNR